MYIYVHIFVNTYMYTIFNSQKRRPMKRWKMTYKKDKNWECGSTKKTQYIQRQAAESAERDPRTYEKSHTKETTPRYL